MNLALFCLTCSNANPNLKRIKVKSLQLFTILVRTQSENQHDFSSEIHLLWLESLTELQKKANKTYEQYSDEPEIL